MNTGIIPGIIIPFIGTSLGAACVFFMKNELKKSVQRALTVSFRICTLMPKKPRAQRQDLWERLKSASGHCVFEGTKGKEYKMDERIPK